MPVLAVTAQAMKGHSERLKAAGFDAYLSKWLDIDDLTVAVSQRCPTPGG
jgi:CheY-like chemotaxis protein